MHYQEKQPVLGILEKILNNNQNESNLLDLLKLVTSKYDVLSEFFTKIDNDSKYLDLVANHSYHHSNGFDKLVIDSLDEFGMKLRLHIWENDNSDITNSDIHSHSWHYASLVLNGSYRTLLYSKESQGKLFYKRNMPTLKDLDLDSIDSIKSEKLDVILDSIFPKNSMHYLHKDALHKIIQPAKMTCTLVLQGEHIGGNSEVYNRKEIVYGRKVVPKYYTNTELLKLIEKLKTATNRVDGSTNGS